MRIAFLALSTKAQRRIEVHAAAAAADGHDTEVYVHGLARWAEAVFPAEVRVTHIAADFKPRGERRLARLFVRRLPLGLLRRLGRGPLRAPCKRLAGAWKFHVIKKLDARRKRDNARARRETIDAELTRVLAERAPDRLILVDGGSTAVAARILPQCPPGVRDVAIMYGYEDFKEPLHA
ncbi:MAG TPA: hypothetical protein VFU12_12850 [Glycomyces sp.]|nr:hypothetical protein [Glycomyces sp.]